MAVDIYVKMSNGLDGECREDVHAQWMQVESVQFGVRQNATFRVSSSGNQAAGTAEFNPINVRMIIDASYPKLAMACWKGTHIDTVQIDFVRAGHDKQIFLTYNFKNALISSINLVGESQGDDNLAVVEYQFVYSEIVNTYFPTLNEGGGVSGSIASGFDLAKRVDAA